MSQGRGFNCTRWLFVYSVSVVSDTQLLTVDSQVMEDYPEI